MAKKDLSKRKIWQDYSGANATTAERNFYSVFKNIFKDTIYMIEAKPKVFSEIYVNIPLDKKTITEIYNPKLKIKKHGISPDYVITNIQSKKKIFIEVKRQDGWVEGKSRAAGRGNAHERSCKFFTPGLIKILRNETKITDENHLPFWVVFMGDITRDPCRVREIKCWYNDFEKHYFMWRDLKIESLINHFEVKLKNLLD